MRVGKWVRSMKKKDKGNIGDIVIMGFFIIAMMTVMVCFIDCVGMLQTRAEVGQLARKYILIAETNGYIPEADKDTLLMELESIGITDVDISGTTLTKTDFGRTVTVCIRGNINEEYEVIEKRTSTAKF